MLVKYQRQNIINKILKFITNRLVKADVIEEVMYEMTRERVRRNAEKTYLRI